MKLSLLKWEDADFWHAKTQLPQIGVKTSSYIDELLARIYLSSECSVLDVGCGNGTISIPLAKKIRHVTALDSDPGLLPTLTHKCMSEGISNLRFANEDWLQARIGIDIEPHDIVLASRFRRLIPIQNFLEQMHQASNHLCYLTWIVDRKEIDSEICEILGKEYHPLPDYKIICNVLNNMGIEANVDIFEAQDTHRFESEEDAVEEVMRGYKVESHEAKERITALVKSELKQRDGFWWKDTTTKWALIWWRK
jgi:SAM-dependent methyltransferase